MMLTINVSGGLRTVLLLGGLLGPMDAATVEMYLR